MITAGREPTIVSIIIHAAAAVAVGIRSARLGTGLFTPLIIQPPSILALAGDAPRPVVTRFAILFHPLRWVIRTLDAIPLTTLATMSGLAFTFKVIHLIDAGSTVLTRLGSALISIELTGLPREPGLAVTRVLSVAKILAVTAVLARI